MKKQNFTILWSVFFLGLSFTSFSQESLSLETIADFKENYHSVSPIATQIIPYKDSYQIRFPELKNIYNPTFPNTRNRVKVENYWIQEKQLTDIGFSISTFRASVRLKGRTGQFYSIWKGESCSSLLEYTVKRVGDNLEVTGKVYKCFSRA